MENEIEDELITPETARLAKEKGFDLNLPIRYFRIGDKIIDAHIAFADNADEELGQAPTQSLLQRWLRQVHGLEIQIFTMGIFMNKLTNPFTEFKTSKPFKKYCFGLNAHYGNDDRGFDTYEKALEKALQTALEIIK